MITNVIAWALHLGRLCVGQGMALPDDAMRILFWLQPMTEFSSAARDHLAEFYLQSGVLLGRWPMQLVPSWVGGGTLTP